MTIPPLPSGPAHTVSVTEHLWIPMPDGTRLAARLWLPDSAEDMPCPALLEYIPYRKADMVRARDARNHPCFAAHGYACLRVDMRGSGDSEGVMPDMYAEAELDDARRVIEWIAAQPWCSGKVGMFGTSWGGTAALQASVDAPGALKAVIAVCATHDRYEDDIHHMGGCLLTDTLEWGATLPAILAAPPTPAAGPDWRDLWRKRLDSLAFPVEPWLREEARGTYWRRGSVIHEAARLTRPILAIGGWSDRYSNSVMSLAAARPDLVWGVVGPWGHHYPDHGAPGPAMGFQDLALAWWDHWLRDAPSPPDWPRLRLWLREFDTPADTLAARAGRWIEADTSDTDTQRLTLGTPALATASPAKDGWPVPHDLLTGAAAGDTGYFGRPGGLPLDQAPDDARALTFDTPPLDADRILLGPPSLTLDIRAPEEPAQIALRLSDVAPDGRVALITRTIRNLALDDGLDAPSGPLPSRRRITISFPHTAYRLAAGHRLRLALSSSYWPLIWPAATTAMPRIAAGWLDLPVTRSAPAGLAQPLPPARDLPREKPFEPLENPPLERVFRTTPDGTRREDWHQPYTALRHHDIATTFGYETSAAFSLDPGNPASARATHAHRAVYARPDGTAEIACTLTTTADAAAFHLDGHLSVTWNGDALATRHWAHSVPRRYG
ncbi:CocE/NonD family hydrolase [Ovoidimarina sediminis]|uniref:CocE/NonD family hydrolase n=1 Tax=Ovoidimarina sediminis TaxID=3079856 RepID=UPI00290FE60E|nr:CocE/NonD family hydrolase [Rhodophyticola sp. MJ-SS7]MDU8945765.1 CocE/NonD family hydrolase [Rhodophyticola sp. MJ-SS7]